MFCTNCGAVITSTHEFCTSCGADLRSIVVPAEQSRQNSSASSEFSNGKEDSRRGTSSVLLALVGVAVLLVGVVAGVLVTSAGAASFMIGERYTEGQLETAANAARQSGFENGKKTGYNDGFSDGKSDGYNTGFDAGKAEGYDTGYEAGSSVAFTDGYRIGKSEGYDEGYSSGKSEGYDSGYDDGKSEGYDEGYSSGKSDGYDSGYDTGYTYGCEAIFRLMGTSSFTYRSVTYYKTSFCT